MAQVSMNDFLLQYMMQMRIRKMDPAVMAQFTSYIGKDDFRGHMKEWRNNLMEQVGGKWRAKDMPDPNGPDYELNDEEWKKLFIEFRSAFRAMAANRKELEGSVNFGNKNEKALEFLNNYFGTGKLFSQSKASDEAEVQIAELKKILEKSENKGRITRFLQIHNLVDYDSLIKGIEGKKYNTSDSFQKQLKDVADYLSYYSSGDELSVIDFSSCNLNAITNGFTDDDTNLTSTPEFQDFKTGEYDIILREIYDKSKIRDAFPSEKVKNAYNKAKELTGYDDKNSKDYVPPKKQDELNPFQRFSEFVDDTYADVFEKYVKFQGDRLYFSPQAKEIVSAIHKAKIKPTDGLDKVLESTGKIAEGLRFKSPTAAEHFDWFTKTMTSIKAKMPKAFEGALRNGRQMRAVISELIKTAVENGKEKEAKTAMEVLSVIRYGFTTSKIMDTLKETDFTLFSDSKLSWNKNEATQFITKALDKSVKWAFMGIGYGITIAGNAISQSGIKYNKKRDNRLKNDDELNKQRDRLDKQTTRMQTRATALQTKRHDDINPRGTSAADTITESNLATHQGNLATSKANANAEQTALNAIKTGNQTAFQHVEQHKTAKANKTAAEATKAQLDTEIANIQRQINTINADPSMSDMEKQARINMLVGSLTEKEQKRQEAEQQLTDAENTIRAIESGGATWDADQDTVRDYEARMSNLTDQKSKNDQLEARLNKWDSATRAINELNKQITNNQNTLSTWDEDHNTKYTELMAYWDMLETGRDFHTGKMYNWGTLKKSTAQENFDNKKNTYIADYLAQYGRIA